jgi:hypothetical protein
VAKDEDLLFAAACLQFGAQGTKVPLCGTSARRKYADLPVDIRFEQSASTANTANVRNRI